MISSAIQVLSATDHLHMAHRTQINNHLLQALSHGKETVPHRQPHQRQKAADFGQSKAASAIAKRANSAHENSH